MITRRAFALAPLAALACGRQRATGYPGYAFIANGGERSVAVVDLERFAVARQIQLDLQPAAVVADAARRMVYVLAPQNATIYQIDVRNLAVRRSVALGGTGLSMRLAADGASLWVLSRSPHALIRVTLDGFAVSARVKLQAAPDDFDLSRDGGLATASFPDTQSVAVIDLARAAVERVAAAGPDPRLVSFRLDTRQILIANRSERMATVVDVKTAGILVHLPLPVKPEHFCLKGDGGQLFITGAGMDVIVVVHPYHTEVAETVLAGKAPGAMSISPQQTYLFAVNPDPGDVTVLEVETRDVLAVVKVGQEPCGVTFTPDNQYALVLNHRSGDLAVIRLSAIGQSRSQSRTRTAPIFTMIAVGAEPVGVAVAGA